MSHAQGVLKAGIVRVGREPEAAGGSMSSTSSSTPSASHLLSSVWRRKLYVPHAQDPLRQCFENFRYVEGVSSAEEDLAKCITTLSLGPEGRQLRLKDFLASIPSFSDLSDQQLLTLERHATLGRYEAGEVIFRQGDRGENFYVIHDGLVDVIVQEPDASKESISSFTTRSSSDATQGATDYEKDSDSGVGAAAGAAGRRASSSAMGKVVNHLTGGCYFGERALMTDEARAATCVSVTSSTCLLFSREVYEEVMSGSNSLIGKDVSDAVDLSKDHETRSLFRHIERVMDIEIKQASEDIKQALFELSTVFTPELSTDEIISRMVLTIKSTVKADRVGLFLLNEDQKSMVLRVSDSSKGVRLPLRGLAGVVIEKNESLNIADAYKDPRFDGAMDRRTGYKTRQVLGVPVRHPMTGDVMGMLQVNNRTDSPEAFSNDQQTMVELTALQLSELLHNRADIFLLSGASKFFGQQGSEEGTTILHSSAINSPFQVELFSLALGQSVLDTAHKEGLNFVEVTLSLHLALNTLCETRTVVIDLNAPSGTDIKMRRRIEFPISVRDLPRATRILFKLSGKKRKGGTSSVPLGWAAATLFDFKGVLESLVDVRMFTGDIDFPITTTLSNSGDNRSSYLSAILAADIVLADNAAAPRVKIVHEMPERLEPIIGDEDTSLSEEQKRELDRLFYMSFNPIGASLVTEESREFLWNLRYKILHRADILPAFVMSIPWKNAERVQELYELLDLWKKPLPSQALLLLDRRFLDPKVRAFAVYCLEPLDDEELGLFMLQLCQQLKFENHVDSALARFLLRRALKAKTLIGHIFYWLLHSELHNVDVKKRFIILLQIYIRFCGHHRVELGHQVFVMKRLEAVAELVCQGESKSARKQILHEQLSQINLPESFQLPLNPHLKVKGIDVANCRVMESKKKPLWLSCFNANEKGQDIVLMLKVGDDLRQDALIMQLLRVMNDLWRKEGLDMQMMLYDCISTGDERGLLQVVLNAKTLGNILLDTTDMSAKRKGKNPKNGSLSRKLASAMRALSDFTVFKLWIEEQVRESLPEGDEDDVGMELAARTQNFIISTAAYCVASYVLGLGDRHNDNLMITKDAHFFHIDFGHILGNFKSKYGVKRERAPFVFTHAMKAVMSNEQYDSFVELCCDIYNILRENASILVSLCSLAIPCNLPELQREEDVLWIYEKLLVGKTEEEASMHFRKAIDVSLGTRTTRINDATHMLAHA